MFYDSHAVLVDSGIHVLDPRGDGVHLTVAARRVMTDRLIDALSFEIGRINGEITSVNKGRWAGFSWPLRPDFRNLIV